jgi:hypothetical protein
VTDEAPKKTTYNDTGCVPLVLLCYHLEQSLGDLVVVNLTGGPHEVLFEVLAQQPATTGGAGEPLAEGAQIKRPLEHPRIDKDPWVLDAQTSKARWVLAVYPDGRMQSASIRYIPVGPGVQPGTPAGPPEVVTWEQLGQAVLLAALRTLL